MQKKTWILIATMALSLNAAFADPVEPVQKEETQKEEPAQKEEASVTASVETSDCSVQVETNCTNCQ